jgi:phosphocarrier protein HPr
VSQNGETCAQATVVVRNKNGLHARPSSLLAEAAMRFKGTSVTVARGDIIVDAKSIMELLLLEATSGTELTLSAEGPEAEAAIEQLSALFERAFDVSL